MLSCLGFGVKPDLVAARARRAELQASVDASAIGAPVTAAPITGTPITGTS